jgi:hypothetical protein
LRRNRQDKYDALVRERDGLALEKATLQDAIHDLNRRLQTEESTVNSLQQQVTYYKTNISSATRIPDQMADDVVKRRIDDIFRSIQNFVVRYFRGCVFGEYCRNLEMGLAMSDEEVIEYELLHEDLKLWMDDHIPFAHLADCKEHSLNIAISVIAKYLTDRTDAHFYFGWSETLPVNAASTIVRHLRRSSFAWRDSIMAHVLTLMQRRKFWSISHGWNRPDD